MHHRTNKPSISTLGASTSWLAFSTPQSNRLVNLSRCTVWTLELYFGRMCSEAGDDEEAPPEPPERVTHRPLSPLARLYVYALHGCLCEVGFTAVWDWWETKDRRLAGHTSLWALPMYALAIFLIEGLRGRLLAQRCPLLLRMLVYTLFIYLWEFSWGVVLRILGACPWDYSGFSYNLAGLVTLEYALPWALASLIAEQHVIRKTLRVRLTN